MSCQNDFKLIGISAKLVMLAGLLFTATLDAAEVVVDVPTPRVQRLLAAMSREDKMAVIRGGREPADAAQGEAGWTRGVPRLGIPDLRFADGPPGVLVHHVSTGMPSTLSMAATFSRRDAEATGALLFAFGFGLSYTAFKYSDLTVAKSADGGLDVACRVQNTGTRAGDEVVQVYVGAPKPSPVGVEFAVRALASFDRVTLEPGGSRQVQLHVPSERLQYWSLADQAWHDARAGRRVYVGASLRDLPLSAPISQDGADSVDR